METVREIIKKDKTIDTSCPQCNDKRTISVAELLKKDKSFLVNCSCGISFRIDLESRSMYRKDTTLRGVYANLAQKEDRGHFTISNLSMSGVQLTIRGNHSIKAGQNLLIQFRLDDGPGSIIRKKANVKGVSDKVIGCEYIESTEFDKALALYLIT